MATDAERNRGPGAYSSPGVDPSTNLGQATITTRQPQVQFKLQQVEPPSSLYISQTDRLMLSAMNDDPNVTAVLLQGRILRAADGQISPFVLSMNVTSDRVPARQMFDMPEGYILGLRVLGSGGTVKGRCYVVLDMAHGSVTNRTLLTPLIADYISRGHDASWPGSNYVHSVDGAGWARSVAGTTPAAGANINEAVPTTARWRLKSGRFRLVTSAAVANRAVKVMIHDGVNPVWLGGFNLIQAASLTQDYSFGIGVPQVNDATGLVVSTAIAENLMFAGWTWQTVVTGLQAADQFSFVEYAVEDWIEL